MSKQTWSAVVAVGSVFLTMEPSIKGAAAGNRPYPLSTINIFQIKNQFVKIPNLSEPKLLTCVSMAQSILSTLLQFLTF